MIKAGLFHVIFSVRELVDKESYCWEVVKMEEKAIESYIENCEYKSDWCCGCAEAHGAILSEPDVCMGRDCPAVKLFIEKLNS